MKTQSPAIKIKNTAARFRNHDGQDHGVNSISFDLKKGLFLGVVGESGSKKSDASMVFHSSYYALIDDLSDKGANNRVKLLEHKLSHK